MKSSWFYLCTSSSEWIVENLVSKDVISLSDVGDYAIIQNPNIVILTIDPIENELVMFHHFTQISGVRLKSQKWLLSTALVP